MADLEAVLADVSYLMAMEKSKAPNSNIRTSKKITLPDPAVKSIMIRYLEDRDEFNFEALQPQKMFYLLLKEYLGDDLKFQIYDLLLQLSIAFSQHQKLILLKQLLEYLSLDFVNSLSKPMVYHEKRKKFHSIHGDKYLSSSSNSSINCDMKNTILTRRVSACDKSPIPENKLQNVNSKSSSNIVDESSRKLESSNFIVKEYTLPEPVILILKSELKKYREAPDDSILINLPLDELQQYLFIHFKFIVFPVFVKSEQFTRFCQWKNIQYGLNLSMSDFSVHRIIGRGGFGEVYGCRKADTGCMYAMKCLDKKRVKLKGGETLALNERQILQQVSSGTESSNFIVGMTYAFTTPLKVCFLLDLMNGGDLHYHLTQHIFTEDEVKFYISEVTLGLEHMHARGVVYRDLKPANILLNETGHIRISDLGLACDFLIKKPVASVGTHGYMAPEVLQRGVAYDSSADWFSLGCMIYKLLRGHSPFRAVRGKDKKEIDYLTLHKQVEMPSSFSPDLCDLLNGLLIKSPPKRLCCTTGDPTTGAEQLKLHPFFKDINWDRMKNLEYKAPMIPPRGEVNAHDAFDIGNFDDDETKGIKLSDQDQELWSDFDIVIGDRWQNEIIDTVFESINSEASKSSSKKKMKAKGGYVDGDLQGLKGQISHSLRKLLGLKEDVEPIQAYAYGKDCIVHGNVFKLSGAFHTNWTKKYFYLFPNRIETLHDDGASTSTLFTFDAVQELSIVQYRSYKCIQLKLCKKSNIKDLFIRFETEPEFTQWYKEIAHWYKHCHQVGKKGLKLLGNKSYSQEVRQGVAIAKAKGDIQPTINHGFQR